MEYNPSPRFVVLQNVIATLKAGQATQENLKQIIDIVAKDLSDLLLLEQDETIFLDPKSRERWAVMKAAILAYQKGLSIVARYLQDKNTANLDKGMEEISVADKQLYEIYAEMNAAFQKAKEEMEAAMYVTCIYCGQKSHKDSRACEHCGKTLTKGFQSLTEYSDMDEDTGQIQEFYQEVEDYTNISKLKELAAGVLNNQVPPKELIGYAEELKGMFKGAQNQFEAIKNIEKNLYPEVIENISSSRQVIGELLAALDSLIAGIKSGDLSHIEENIVTIDGLANHLGVIKQNFINISQQLSSNM